MTDHPLTDEMIEEMAHLVEMTPWYELNLDDYDDDRIRKGMRAAADWQLEQVIEYLENNLEFAIDWSDTFIDRFKKAMRPQEDN